MAHAPHTAVRAATFAGVTRPGPWARSPSARPLAMTIAALLLLLGQIPFASIAAGGTVTGSARDVLARPLGGPPQPRNWPAG